MAKVTGRPAFVEENLSGRTYVEGCDDGGAIKGRSGGQKGKSAIRLEERREKGGIPGGRRCGRPAKDSVNAMWEECRPPAQKRQSQTFTGGLAQSH